jgi:hypothetical protein
MYDMPGLGVTPDFNRLNPSPTAPKIIGLAGYARAGKDTVAGIINRLYGHQVTSFSDILREFNYAQNLFLSDGCRLNKVVDRVGWERAREIYPEIRDLQQLTGTEAARNILGQSVWVDAWMRRVSEAGGLWVNPSTRFVNEGEAIKALGGVVLRVVKPGIKAVNDHPSDTAMDGYDFDGLIMNDGTLIDLEGEVQRVLGEFDA